MLALDLMAFPQSRKKPELREAGVQAEEIGPDIAMTHSWLGLLAQSRVLLKKDGPIGLTTSLFHGRVRSSELNHPQLCKS